MTAGPILRCMRCCEHTVFERDALGENWVLLTSTQQRVETGKVESISFGLCPACVPLFIRFINGPHQALLAHSIAPAT